MRFCYDGKVLAGSSCVAPGSPIPFSIGRLTATNAVLNERTIHAFDPLGRVLSDSQTTVTKDSPWTAETYTFAYSYNRDGSLASQAYPSGRVIQHAYDGSGRPYSTFEPGGGPSYVNSTAYAPHGGLDHFQLGNLLVEQTCYNDRLQPAARRLGASASTACAGQGADLLRLGFGYGAAAANNGNMVEQSIWAPDDGSGSAWQVAQAYTYDQVNRIVTAAESKGGVQQWSRTYSYDHFGNRWLAGATGHTLHAATPTSAAQIEAATNRLASSTGAAYDAAGNMTSHPFITPGGGGMTYDANNKMTAFAATGVSVATKYDAEGRRVRTVHNGQTTVWVYDAFGKLAAEYTTAVSTDTGVYYRTTDHLGSTRLTTNDAVEVVSRRDYFPFGERIDSTLSGRGGVADGVLASYNGNPGMGQQFTGQQRDDETGLDYFWARNYHPALGRFLSVDPRNSGASRAVPQSWNAYGYVEGNPLALIDPSGLYSIAPSNESLIQILNAELYGPPPVAPADSPLPYGSAVLSEWFEGFAPFVELQTLPLPHGWGYDCIDWTCTDLNVTIPTSDFDALLLDLGLVDKAKDATTIGAALCPFSPVGCVVAAGGAVVVIGGISYEAYKALARHFKRKRDAREARRTSAPRDAPRGTKPIDKVLSTDEIHKIKKGYEIAPDDWTGVTPDGRVITTNPETGDMIVHGPIF